MRSSFPRRQPAADPVISQFLNTFDKAPQWGDVGDFDGYADVVTSALAEVIVETCYDISPAG